jgi:hypothetical protein
LAWLFLSLACPDLAAEHRPNSKTYESHRYTSWLKQYKAGTVFQLQYVAEKKAPVEKSETLDFLIPRGILNYLFADFFCIKLLLYLLYTVRKIKNPIFYLYSTIVQHNYFARFKKTKYFFL